MKRPISVTNSIVAKMFKALNKNDLPVKERVHIKPFDSRRSTLPIERRKIQVLERNNLEEKVMQILANSSKQAMKRVLSLGELSLPQPQFKAFRKEVFDLFGTRELRRVAREILLECMGSNSHGFGEGRRF